MIERGQLGEKTGKGFYERRKGAGGETEIWTLDLQTLEYRAKQSAKIASIEAGKSMDDLAERRAHAVPQQGQGRRSSCARRWRPRWSTRRASRPRSPTPSTTWTG
jgi:3-hydroxyacyl-CoA dehydrogenase